MSNEHEKFITLFYVEIIIKINFYALRKSLLFSEKYAILPKALHTNASEKQILCEQRWSNRFSQDIEIKGADCFG